MHQEEFSSMSSYLNDIQLMALKVIPFHPRLLSTKHGAFRKNLPTGATSKETRETYISQLINYGL